MLNSFIRTVILLVTVIIALRLMGKRQIAQLQPAELVVTILLSQIAATPMQDNDIPMVNTFISILVLVGMEIILSAVSLKNGKIRDLLQGRPVILIRNGVIDQRQMKRLRYSLDDLLETLRKKDVFDITEVRYAIAETNGDISILLRSDKRPMTPGDAGVKVPDGGYPVPVVMDGRIIAHELKNAGIGEKELEKLIKRSGLAADEIFLMTVDESGGVHTVKKEEDR